MGRHKACVSWTTPSCCCESCLLIRSGSAMPCGVPLRWRSSVPPRVWWCCLRRDRLRISLDILRSVGWTRVSGLEHSSFYTHEECSFGRLFVGRLRTGDHHYKYEGCCYKISSGRLRLNYRKCLTIIMSNFVSTITVLYSLNNCLNHHWYTCSSIQVCMCETLNDLHAHVDPSQLTDDLGGSLRYDHSEWIQHRAVSQRLLAWNNWVRWKTMALFDGEQ